MQSHIEKNHFEALGLEIGASKAAVRAAYKAQAQRTHPDRPGGSAEAFQRVQAAYTALCDDATRKACTAYWRNGGPPRLGNGATLHADGWHMPEWM